MAKIITRAGKVAVSLLLMLMFVFALAYSIRVATAEAETNYTESVELDAVSNQSVVIDSKKIEPISDRRRELVGLRDRNTRVWELTKEREVYNRETDEFEIEEVTSKVVYKGCGICYQDSNDNWEITDSSWKETKDGFVMDKAGYSLELGKTAGSAMAYDIDGRQLRIRPSSLYADDGVNSSLIAQIDDSIEGYIDPSDKTKLIFSDAFGDGVDLELVAQPDGFHQNIVFRNKLSCPKGYNLESTKYQLYTEIDLDDYRSDDKDAEQFHIQIIESKKDLDERSPQLSRADDGLEESRFKIDELSDADSTEEDISFVLEEEGYAPFLSHSFVDSEILTRKDSDVALVSRSKSESTDLAKTKTRVRETRIAEAKKHFVRDDATGTTYLVESLDASVIEEAIDTVVWDYHNVNTTISEDEIWTANQTYLVTSNVSIASGKTLRVEPGTVVKFISNARLSGNIIAKGEPYIPIIFTSINDDSCGEIINDAANGYVSTGSPQMGDWDSLQTAMMNAIYYSLQYCKVRYANTGLLVYSQLGDDISGNVFEHCSTAVNFMSTGKICNNLMLHCNQGVSSMSQIEAVNNTIVGSGSGSTGIYVGIPYSTIRNNIFVSLDTAINGYVMVYMMEYMMEYIESHNAFYDIASDKVNIMYWDGSNTSYYTDTASTDIHLSVSPFDSNTSLGDYYLNTAADGGLLLADAGNGDITSTSSVYDNPTDWAIYPVEMDGVHGFETYTALTGDVTWQPDYTRCDGGTVAVGYHYPRIDYCSEASISVGCSKFAINSGTVILHDGYGMWIDINGLEEFSTYDFSENPYSTFISRTFFESNRRGNNFIGFENTQWPPTNTATYEIGFMKFIGTGAGVENNNCHLRVHDCIFDNVHTAINNYSITDFDNSLVKNSYCGLMAEYGADTQVSNVTFVNADRVVSDCTYGQGGINFYNNACYGESVFVVRCDPTQGAVLNEHHNIFFSEVFFPPHDFWPSGDLDSSDWASPSTGNAAGTVNPLDSAWTELSDRYHLLASSVAVDGGYDTTNIGMPGYTTSLSGTVDTGTIDVGYHYVLATLDGDGDGLMDYQEYHTGTNHQSVDTDGDGLVDGDGGIVSVNNYPAGTDADGDGFVDGENDYGTSPEDSDSNNNGISDGIEAKYGLDPAEESALESSLSKYEYDVAGQIISVTSFEIKDGQLRIIKKAFENDILGRKVLERVLSNPEVGDVDADDKVTLFTYDVQGRAVDVIRKGNANTDFTAYQDGDLIDRSYYTEGQIEKKSKFAYESTDNSNYGENRGSWGEYEYVNGVVEKTRSLVDVDLSSNGSIVANSEVYDEIGYSYDSAGRLIKVTDPQGHYKVRNYDSLGRLTNEISNDHMGSANDVEVLQTRFEYDGLGNITRRATMADATSEHVEGSLNFVPVDIERDSVIDYVYAPYTQDDPESGKLVCQKLYYYCQTPSSNGTYNGEIGTSVYKYDTLGRKFQTLDYGNKYNATDFASGLPDFSLTDPYSETSQAYDSMNRVATSMQLDRSTDTSSTEELRLMAGYRYDYLGNLYESVEMPDINPNTWRTTSYEYSFNQRVKETTPANVVSKTNYDSFGNKLEEIKDFGGINQKTSYSYDRLGRMQTIKGYTNDEDASTAQITEYVYDYAGNVLEVRYPEYTANPQVDPLDKIAYTYYRNSQAKSRIDQRNIETTYAIGNTPDSYRQLIKSVTWDDNGTSTSTEEAYVYNALGNLNSATKEDNNVSISDLALQYTGKGKLHTADETYFGAAQSHNIMYTYDQFGYRRAMITSDRPGFPWMRDWKGRESFSLSGKYFHIGSRVDKRLRGTSVMTDYTYDNFGRLTSLTYPGGIDFGYTYKPNTNNIETITYNHRPTDPVTTYSYDNLNRLTQSDYGIESENEMFGMDDLGNRLMVNNRAGVNEIYDVDSLNNQYRNIALSAYWPMDENSGSSVADVISGNDATMQGNAAWGTATVNNQPRTYIDLDGSGDYLKTQVATNNLNVAPGSFSISLWLNQTTNSSTWQTIAEYGRDGYGPNWFGAWISSTGKFHFRVGGTTMDSSSPLTAGQWYLLTATYNASDNSMKMYLNGQLDSASTFIASSHYSAPANEKLTIGTYNDETGQYLNAKIDDMRVFNSVLDGTQIAAIYQVGTDAMLAYDNAGNMARDRRGYTYQYDYENRLKRILKPSGSSLSAVVEYTYDALGRRIKKDDLVTTANSRVYYYNDNWQVIKEYDLSITACQKWYRYGVGIDEVIYVNSPATSSVAYYINNHLNSPVALSTTTASSIIFERYEYDAYGDARIFTAGTNGIWFDADDVYHDESTIGNEYLFTGRRLDTLDGGSLKIQYSRNRYYDAQQGRFISKDPLGIVPVAFMGNERFSPRGQYMDGLNVYGYVQNNPVNRSDSWGLHGPGIDFSKVILNQSGCNLLLLNGSYSGSGSSKFPPFLGSNYDGEYTYSIKVSSELVGLTKEQCKSKFEPQIVTTSGSAKWWPIDDASVGINLNINSPDSSLKLTYGLDGFDKGWFESGFNDYLSIDASSTGYMWDEKCCCSKTKSELNYSFHRKVNITRPGYVAVAAGATAITFSQAPVAAAGTALVGAGQVILNGLDSLLRSSPAFGI